MGRRSILSANDARALRAFALFAAVTVAIAAGLCLCAS